jgi:DNA-binding transcriptional MerR regulator
MAPATVTPTAAARLLGVNPHTVRRWCAAHADHLSAGANPPANATRRLTGRDVEVLRAVAALRDQGLQESQVNARLADLTIAEVDEGSQETAQEAPGTQESDREVNYTALVRLSVLEAVYGADRERWEQERREYQQRIEELQREVGRLEGRQGKRPAWLRKLFGE